MNLREKYEKFYAVTDEKFKKNEFLNKTVPEKFRLSMQKELKLDIFFILETNIQNPLNASVDLPSGKKAFV